MYSIIKVECIITYSRIRSYVTSSWDYSGKSFRINEFKGALEVGQCEKGKLRENLKEKIYNRVYVWYVFNNIPLNNPQVALIFLVPPGLSLNFFLALVPSPSFFFLVP